MNDARPATNIQRLRRMIIGPPRDVSDPQIFHHISLAVFLASDAAGYITGQVTSVNGGLTMAG